MHGRLDVGAVAARAGRSRRRRAPRGSRSAIRAAAVGSGGHQGCESRQSVPIRPPKFCATVLLPSCVPAVCRRGDLWPMLPAQRRAVGRLGTVVAWRMSSADPGAGRDLRAVLRYAVGMRSGCVVLLLLVGKRGELAAAWHQLGRRERRLGGGRDRRRGAVAADLRLAPAPGAAPERDAHRAAWPVPAHAGQRRDRQLGARRAGGVQRLPVPVLPAARCERRQRRLDDLHDPDRAGHRHVADPAARRPGGAGRQHQHARAPGSRSSAW